MEEKTLQSENTTLLWYETSLYNKYSEYILKKLHCKVPLFL